jgi:3-oxoacyl-[acyl-carrier protein] reductase
MSGRLAGQVALVTGSSSGIGRAIAAAYLQEGARVMVTGRRAGRAEEAAAALAPMGEVRWCAGDIAIAAEAQAIVDATVAAFGRLDILVANAGIGLHRLFTETTLAEWERLIATDLTGSFLVAQAAARTMIAQGGGGRMVVIGSISGQRATMGRAAYGAAKAGLMLLTQVMAVELAPFGIRVNTISPGPIRTGISVHGPSTREAFARRLPLGHTSRPESVVGAALHFASAESDWTTGTLIPVDGGFLGAGLRFDATEIAP